MNTHYLANSDGSVAVYFEVDPTPRAIPVSSRIVYLMQCLPSSTGPGQVRVCDMGAHGVTRTLDIYCPYIDETTRTAIQAKFNSIAQVKYSPDNGSTIYTCAWEAGQSFEVSPIPGHEGYTARLRLRVISVA